MKIQRIILFLFFFLAFIGRVSAAESEPDTDKLRLVVQTGHTKGVSSVVFSPDGRTFLSGSFSDKTLKLWDVATGKELRTIRGSTPAEFIDGSTVLSQSSDDDTFKIWDILTGKELRTLKGHKGGGESISVSFDGSIALSGGLDESFKLWDISSGNELNTLKWHADSVHSVVFSPYRSRALSSVWPKDLILWDIATGKELFVLKGHKSYAKVIVFSPDGHTALSGSEDKTLKLWDLVSGKELQTFNGHTGKILSAVIAVDGRTAWSASEDGALKLWDLSTGLELRSVKVNDKRINSVAFSADGQTALLGGSDEIFRLVNLTTGTELLAFKGETGGEDRLVTFSPTGRTVLTGGWNDYLKLWDLVTGKELRSIKGAVPPFAFVDEQTVLSRSRDNTLILWDLTTGKELQTFNGNRERITSIAITQDGRAALTGSYAELKLWNLKSGQELSTFKGRELWGRKVTFTQDAKKFLTATNNNIKLWDVATGNELRSFKVFPRVVDRTENYVSCFAISPDERTVLSGDKSSTLKLWDLNSGELIRTFDGHSEEIYSVAISRDNKTALSSSKDKTLKLWDMATGKELKTIFFEQLDWQDDGMVYSLSFSPDGLTALGAQGKRVRRWDLVSGKELPSYEGHTISPLKIELTKGGQTLFSRSGGYNPPVIWNLTYGSGLQTSGGWDPWVVSPDGLTALSTDSNYELKLWDMTSGKEIRTLGRYRERVSSIAFSPDGHTALSGSYNSIDLWDLNTGNKVRTFDKPIGDVNYVKYLSNNLALSQKYVSSQGSNSLTLWNLDTGRELQTINKTGTDYAIPIGDQTVLTGFDNDLKLWDMSVGKELRTLKGHDGHIYGMAAVLPDGLRVLTGSDDKTLKLWELASGRELSTFKGHKCAVFSIALSKDGRSAISGSCDKTIKIWDLASGKELKTLTEHSNTVTSVIAYDDQKIISASEDNMIIVWDISTGKWLAKLYAFTDGTWVIVDSEGRYDASNGGNVQGIHWVYNNEPIALAQLKERYYEPGLLSKIMGYNKDPLHKVDAFTSVALYPETRVTPPSEKSAIATISLKNRGGGIGKVRVLVNGKEIAADARGSKPDADAKAVELPVEIPESLLIPGKENTIQVLAWNKEGYLSSRGDPVRFKPAASKRVTPPTLYAIVIGVSKYADAKMNLTFSGKDAADMATALSISAKRLFGTEKVDLILLSDDTSNSSAIPPTRDNIAKAFANATNATSSDILVVYMAGHGVMAGSGDESEYYY
ncbi:MAG: caspase family protein, partial [Geobacteraceae bacterium]|nr:caspase family protein [Geobacteraceae bacterium]